MSLCDRINTVNCNLIVNYAEQERLAVSHEYPRSALAGPLGVVYGVE